MIYIPVCTPPTRQEPARSLAAPAGSECGACVRPHPGFTFPDASAVQDSGPQFVQVNFSHASVCARIRQGWVSQSGDFLWSLDLLGPLYGRASFPESRVRQCSGLDGHCSCADEAAKPDRAELATHEDGAADSEGGFCG